MLDLNEGEQNRSRDIVCKWVIIKEEKVKPMHWKKGVVEDVIIGRDNEIRGVKLRTPSPTGKVVKTDR